MPIYAQSSTLRDLVIPLVDIDQGSLQQDDVLQFNSITNKFENRPLSITDPISLSVSGTNLGGGAEVFKEVTTGDLRYRTLTGSSGVSISTVDDNIVIGITGGVDATGLNIGTGSGIFESKVGNEIRLRTLKVSDTSKNLTITGSAGTGYELEFTNEAENNTASNVGGGYGVFKQKTDEDLEFKTIVAGENVNIVSGTDTLTISVQNEPEVAKGYQFTVSFDGVGNISGISDIPVGWSITNSGNRITVVHDVARMMKYVSYFGLDSTNGWQLRFPTAGYQATVPSGEETTKFIIDINASVAGADVSSTAKVNVVI